MVNLSYALGPPGTYSYSGHIQNASGINGTIELFSFPMYLRGGTYTLKWSVGGCVNASLQLRATDNTTVLLSGGASPPSVLSATGISLPEGMYTFHVWGASGSNGNAYPSTLVAVRTGA